MFKTAIKTIAMITVQIVVGCQSTSQSDLTLDIRESSENSLRMGQGYSSFGGVQYSLDKSFCVEQAPISPLGGSPSEETWVYVDSIGSQEQLENSTTNAQDFGVKWQSYSADYKLRKKTGDIYKSSNSYVYVKMRKVFATENMTSHQWKGEAIRHFTQFPQQFFNKCGDRFVSGVKKGAEVLAIMSCETQSKEEKESIDRAVKAEAGFKGVVARGDVQSLLDRVRSMAKNKCNTEIHAYGGGGAAFGVKTSEELISSALTYISQVTLQTASPLEFETLPYTAILNEDFEHNVLSKINLSFESQKRFVEDKKSRILLLKKMIGIVSGTQQQPTEDDARGQIVKLEMQLHRCLKNMLDEENCRDRTVVTLPSGTVFKVPRLSQSKDEAALSP